MSVVDDTVLRAVLELAFDDGNIMQNVFWFLTQFVANQDDNVVAGAVEDWLDTILQPLDEWMSDTLSINQTELNEMVWDEEEEVWEVDRFVGTLDPTATFAETNELLPYQNAAVLVANTGRPKSRGRKSFGGLTEIAQDAGILVPSLLTNMATALNWYLSDETISAGNELISGVASTVTGLFLPFTDGIVNDVMGSQRRRKPGVGA